MEHFDLWVKIVFDLLVLLIPSFCGWLIHTVKKSITKDVSQRIDTMSKDFSKQVGNLSKDLDGISQELKEADKKRELEAARQARQRILRFSDEILHDKRHSKEHFDEILEDIDLYEDYCDDHEDYENNKAVLAIATIREVYKKCLQQHDFLIYTEK